MPNCTEIKETFCGQTDAPTYGHLRRALLGRLCRRVDLKINEKELKQKSLSREDLIRDAVHDEQALPNGFKPAVKE